jgi:hypothetical protein
MIKVIGFVLLKIGYFIGVVTMLLCQIKPGNYISLDLPLFYGIMIDAPNAVELKNALNTAGILVFFGLITIMVSPKPHV